jgi:hypothetical protein
VEVTECINPLEQSMFEYRNVGAMSGLIGIKLQNYRGLNIFPSLFRLTGGFFGT